MYTHLNSTHASTDSRSQAGGLTLGDLVSRGAYKLVVAVERALRRD